MFRQSSIFSLNSVRALSRSSKRSKDVKEALILGAVRTPVGSFRSSLASLSAPELGSIAIRGVLEKTKVPAEQVQEIFLGNVLQANVGQAPARQAVLKAGLSPSTAVTTVNKVCSSGLKSIILAAQQIQLDHQKLCIGGGMESMSNAPFYISRNEPTYGGFKAEDSILKDGLTDAFDGIHMGSCGEKTSREQNISRKEQDDYAIRSYTLAAESWEKGVYDNEVIPVIIKTKKGDVVVSKDEEYPRVNFDKLRTLRTVFQKENGHITAGNAPSINDGACAVLLSSAEKAAELGIKPLAKVVTYGDAAFTPLDFALAPGLVIPKMLKQAGLQVEDISLFEINEAFSVVALATIKTLGLDINKVNAHGGAVALGHPIGMSGARILTHLVHNLKTGQFGAAAICNGGGGASGMIIQKL